jgi:hypothetical protein
LKISLFIHLSLTLTRRSRRYWSTWAGGTWRNCSRRLSRYWSHKSRLSSFVLISYCKGHSKKKRTWCDKWCQLAYQFIVLHIIRTMNYHYYYDDNPYLFYTMIINIIITNSIISNIILILFLKKPHHKQLVLIIKKRVRKNNAEHPKLNERANKIKYIWTSAT